MAHEVNAVTRAAALLRVLAKAEEPLGASEAARRAGVARNTAFRTLRTLVQLGWVSIVDDVPRYRLSQEPARLFGNPWERSRLTVAAHPPLKRLAAAVHETVYLAVRDGERSVNVQVIEGRGLLRIAGALGQGFPLHASAPGKVFLAFEPGVLDRVCRRALPRLTAATLTSAAALRQEIRRVRQQGWALNREELAEGLNGMAYPVLGADSTCCAALGILTPVSVCRSSELAKRYGPLLQAAAAEISTALGRHVVG